MIFQQKISKNFLSGQKSNLNFKNRGYFQRRTYALGFKKKVADSTRIPGKKVADSTGFRGKKVADSKFGIPRTPRIPGFRDSGIPGFQREKNPGIPRDSWDST